jgi:5-methylcytosine-specific restriction endonuclease McrA
MKQARSKLDAKSYRELQRHILDRDGWRCQNCGTPTNLQVHHVTWRSKLGADSEENLMALCATCHSQVHNRFGSKTLE